MKDTEPRDPLEVELKLRLPPGSRSQLEQVPAFHDAEAKQRHEMTTYYDTPGLELLQRGAALRVRQTGGRRIQTLKAQDRGNRVAAARGEWEWEVDADSPDLARLAETPYAELARTIDGQLQPVFSTDIHRTIRLLHPGNGLTIEAALDNGRVVAGNHSAPVSELELELKGGSDLGALYRFALDLHQAVPLSIAGESKAARGYRLRTGRPAQSRKAGKLDLPNGI